MMFTIFQFLAILSVTFICGFVTAGFILGGRAKDLEADKERLQQTLDEFRQGMGEYKLKMMNLSASFTHNQDQIASMGRLKNDTN